MIQFERTIYNEETLMKEDFVPFDGDYVKKFYDVLLNDGNIVIHCWPNAGKFAATDGSGRFFEPEDIKGVRLSLTHPMDKYRK